MNLSAATKAENSPRGTQDERVYSHIFDAILEQRLLPGTRLSEEALGEIFSVSRTIIRRALTRLAQEGVVEQIPNKGAAVASPSPEVANEVLTARKIIEEAILRLAINQPKGKNIKQLRRLIDVEQTAFERGDRGAGLRLSGEFHLQLAAMANNQPLQTFLGRLVSQTSLIIATYESPSQASHCSYDEHRQLVSALESGALEQAIKLMNHHIEHIQVKLQLNRSNDQRDLHQIFADIEPGQDSN